MRVVPLAQRGPSMIHGLHGQRIATIRGAFVGLHSVHALRGRLG